jgi:hypothetical protein
MRRSKQNRKPFADELIEFLDSNGYELQEDQGGYTLSLPRVAGYILHNLTSSELFDYVRNHCYPGYKGKLWGKKTVEPHTANTFSGDRAIVPFQIINADYRSISIPDSALIVSDPPFGIGYKYDKHNDEMSSSEWLDLMDGMRGRPCVLVLPWQQAYLLASRWGSPSDQAVWTFRSGYRGHQHRLVMWYGCKPQMARPEVGQPFVDHNGRWAVKARKQGRTLARRSYHWHVEQVMSRNKERTAHPCQMPEEVMRLIIQSTAQAGQPIFDPFLGSGTTGVAAVRHGFPFVGSDISEGYCEIAQKRIGSVAESQPVLRSWNMPELESSISSVA